MKKIFMKPKEEFFNRFYLIGLVTLCCLNLATFGIAMAIEHSGNISADETWMAVDNPHEITGNVTVQNLITLTLEPGVEVLFKGNYVIYVYGALVAQGTQSDQIRFTRATGVPAWSGLCLYQGSGGILDFCIIEWANQAISANSCYLTVSNCTIRNNTYGLYATTLNPYLADNIFENNGTGMRLDNYYAPTVRDGLLADGGENNVFRDNGTGIHFYDCMLPTVGGTAHIADNTTYGVYFRDCASPGLSADILTSGTGIYYQNCTDISSLEDVSLIANTGEFGAVRVQGSGPVRLGAGNTIADNTYPLSIDAASYATEDSILPLAENHANGIRVDSGTSQQDAAWYDFGLPYMVTTSPTLGASASLTVEPGVEVRLGSNTYIYNYGDLQVNGSDENGVIFTRDQAARWTYIRFLSGATGSLSYATVEFASYGLHVNTAAPEVDHCRLQNNTNGYYGEATATSYIHNCLIANNDYGVRSRSGSDPLINQNSIMQNYYYGVLQEDIDFTIDAEGNYWGDASGPRHVSNPGGRGDFVSDWVDFDPWLASDPL
jgi:hypothetical protein